MPALDAISALWPLVLGFVTLVIVLAKMHSDIDTIKDLKKELKQAIAREDYELASRLRDDIEKRENPQSE